MAELPDDVRALFERPNYAHIATVLPDGGPHSVPVWIALEGDRIAFFTQERSRKARNLPRPDASSPLTLDRDPSWRSSTIRRPSRALAWVPCPPSRKPSTPSWRA